jgi:hypothetical protein
VAAAIEIKSNKTAMPAKGFYESIKVLKPAKSYVINPNGETFPVVDGIIMCSLQHFIKSELSKL